MKASIDVTGTGVLSEILDDCSSDSLLIDTDNDQFDHEAFADVVHFLAGRLADAHVGTGTRVAMVRDDTASWIVGFCASAELGATVVDVGYLSDARDADRYMGAADAEFFLAGEVTEPIIDELGPPDIPVALADGYTLVRVGEAGCSEPHLLHFAGDRVRVAHWSELLEDARRLVAAAGFDETSTVYLSKSMSAPHAWTLVLAALMSGGSIQLS